MELHTPKLDTETNYSYHNCHLNRSFKKMLLAVLQLRLIIPCPRHNISLEKSTVNIIKYGAVAF